MKRVDLYVYGRSRVSGKWWIDENRIVNRIYFVNSGWAKIRTSFGEYILTEGNVYVIPQCRDYSVIDSESFDHTYFDFYSSRPLMPGELIEIDAKKLSLKGLFDYINNIIERDQTKTSKEGMEDMIAAFLFFAEKTDGCVKYVTNARITRAVDIIQREYRTITTKQLAKTLSLNESYFIRQFTSVMGISPMKYIRAYKVSRGEIMIENGMSISEASEACGYSSPSAFYKAVVTEYGKTPTEIKKSRKEIF